jgi:glyoxylase-like metal-dependent hydrolase (beta-lactamase superfamily II)
MSTESSQQLGNGITCIDANYIRPGMACFYLLEGPGEEGPERESEYALIETGTTHSLDNLLQLMERRGIDFGQIRYVIPTHVHLDHAGGAGAMMERFPAAQLLVHPRGARHLVDPGRLVASSEAVYGVEQFRQLYGEIRPIAAHRVVEVADGETIRLGSRELLFRHTRGHADHHFCIWDASSRGWFSGDMFGVSYPWFRFAGGDFLMPTTTPTQFDPQAHLESIALLAGYQPQRMYLTHYGEFPFSGHAVELISEQLCRYRDLAVARGGDRATIETALLDYSVALMGQYDLCADETERAELLAFDIGLNAQGLEVWQQRQGA